LAKALRSVMPQGGAACTRVGGARYQPRADEKVGVLLCGANVELGKLAALAG
jgi:hypothetical protein